MNKKPTKKLTWKRLTKKEIEEIEREDERFLRAVEFMTTQRIKAEQTGRKAR